MVWSCAKEEGWSCLGKGIRLEVKGKQKKGRKEAKEDLKEAGKEKRHEGWSEHGRCTLPIKGDCLGNQMPLG